MWWKLSQRRLNFIRRCKKLEHVEMFNDDSCDAFNSLFHTSELLCWMIVLCDGREWDDERLNSFKIILYEELNCPTPAQFFQQFKLVN